MAGIGMNIASIRTIIPALITTLRPSGFFTGLFVFMPYDTIFTLSYNDRSKKLCRPGLLAHEPVRQHIPLKVEELKITCYTYHFLALLSVITK
jgi:hypothetical protein